VIAVVSIIFQYENLNSIIEEIEDYTLFYLILLVPYAMFINVMGDYFSLWETRLIVGRIAKRILRKHRFLLLLLDVLVSTLIFVAGLILGSATFLATWVLGGGDLSFFGDGSWLYHLFSLIKEIMSLVFIEGGLSFSDQLGIGSFFGILLYTTFFTSVWVWVFFIGVTFLPFVTQLCRIFKVEKYPVGVAMCVGGAAVGLVTTIVGFAMG